MFIHGFNVSFGLAARRTAQLSYDLKFQGVSMLYSWPSQGKLAAYTSDEDKILWTRPRLQAFLTLVATELGVAGVHIIAHSMGNRALVEVLKDLTHEMPYGAAPLTAGRFRSARHQCTNFRGSGGEVPQIATSVYAVRLLKG